ncbi:MAG: permease [Firmicutes bacterium HGW-Firmicutes-12]|jgi:uncharacterized membrane protein YraQ (UPF0718 family)|nr:MAG: permease [Firmicutes bacterium HGW-Firmicutes-12]
MDLFFTYYIYVVTVGFLVLSFVKDRKKTILALIKSWKMFLTVLPQFIAILLLVGLLLAAVMPETIQNIIGAGSGVFGIVISSLVGAFSLVPVLIAFPIASELLKNGAGIMQMTVFISTLTTVGFVTLPLEVKYLGKKTAVLRNVLALVFSFVVAYAVKVVMS